MRQDDEYFVAVILTLLHSNQAPSQSVSKRMGGDDDAVTGAFVEDRKIPVAAADNGFKEID